MNRDVYKTSGLGYAILRSGVKAAGGEVGGNTDALTYNPTTGTWVPSSSTPPSSSEDNKPKESPSTPPSTSGGKSKVDSKTKAEKEYIETEFNTLTGDLSIVSSEKTIRIKVNETVKLEGLGNYLSGLYYVSAIKRSLSKDGGYTHTLSLLKNGFGSSLKKAQSPEPTTPPRKDEVEKSSPALKVGDSVKIVGADAVYSNAHDGVKVPNWVKKKTLTVDAISKDGSRVRLNPIWSWTYIKYVQKV